ncbi:unnamed protein product, partial [Ectocarpus sp. 4 AP-2014]
RRDRAGDDRRGGGGGRDSGVRPVGLASGKLGLGVGKLDSKGGVKNHLLEYATSALLFTDKVVSKNVISWSK